MFESYTVKAKVNITPSAVRAYLKEEKADSFLDFMMLAYEGAVKDFLDENRDDFVDFVVNCCGDGGISIYDEDC